MQPLQDIYLLSYLTNGPVADPEAASAVKVALDDEYTKLVNLSHDLLRTFMPHLLGKIDRVSFGLLPPNDLKLALESDPNMPGSRKISAIPFVGKDVPSRASQFSHPDVIIGLNILGYRYEGLRKTDFSILMTELRETWETEFGLPYKRPSALKFSSWIKLAGGKVRGPVKNFDTKYEPKKLMNYNLN